MVRISFLALPFLLGCTGIGAGSESITGETTACVRPSDRGVNNGPLPENCAKIEGGDICNATQIVAGDTTVTITGWIHKDGEQGECIGFTYTVDGSATITVKASTQVLTEDGDGTFLFERHGISNVVACENDDGDDGTTDPNDGDDGDDGDLDPVDGDDGMCDPDTDGDGVPDSEDPDADGDGELDNPDGSTCTADEDCESGECLDGYCISV